MVLFQAFCKGDGGVWAFLFEFVSIIFVLGPNV